MNTLGTGYECRRDPKVQGIRTIVTAVVGVSVFLIICGVCCYCFKKQKKQKKEINELKGVAKAQMQPMGGYPMGQMQPSMQMAQMQPGMQVGFGRV